MSRSDWVGTKEYFVVMGIGLVGNVIWSWHVAGVVYDMFAHESNWLIRVAVAGHVALWAVLIWPLVGVPGEIIGLWKKRKSRRRPPIFLSTGESPPQRRLHPSGEQAPDHPVLLSPSESLPPPKLLTPGEQASDNPEDIRHLQDGQQ